MLYWIGRTLFSVFLKLVFRLKVSGREYLPSGGFIIATNHNSLLDPPLIGTALTRGVYFMAKKELFRIPVFGKIISKTHAIPVDRRAPGAESIKEALNILNSGKILMVLPEGTRKKTGKIKAGIGLLAHKSGVPVVPARIINNDRLKKIARLEFRIGRPVKYYDSPESVSAAAGYRKFAEFVMSRVYSL